MVQGFCAAVFRVIDSLILLVVIGIQGAALNFLMVKFDYENKYLYYWFAGDGLVILVFIITLILSYRSILVKVHSKLDRIDIPHIEIPMYGTLPFGYISWFIYGSLMVCKIIYIFQSDIPLKLGVKFDLYSTSSLMIVLSLSVVIFILLVNTEHDAEPNSDRNSYIGDLCKGVAFDLFDTIVFLLLLLPQDPPTLEDKTGFYNPELDHNQRLHDAILGLACANFLIPGFSLMKLSLSDFGEQTQPIKLSLFTKTLKLFGINIPYMIIRIYLFNPDKDMPVFLIKNVLATLVSLRYMIPEYFNACRCCCSNTHSTSAVKPINIMT